MSDERFGTGGERRRGQTTLDFLVGASVFLLTIALVLAFVPSTFDPFVTSGAENLVVSDRSAAHLAEDALVADPRRPGVLDAACVVVFFNEDADGTVAANQGCRFDGDASLPEMLGSGSADVEVVIHRPDDGPAAPSSAVRVVDGTEYDTTFRRATGDPTGGDVSVARRMISYDGQQYRLTVRVW